MGVVLPLLLLGPMGGSSAYSPDGSNGGVGTTTAAALEVSGTVEYTLRDAGGNLKGQGMVHNTINQEALDITFARLFNDTASNADGYDAIAALSVPPATDDPSDGVDAASITLELDGDSGTGGDQNPAHGVVSAPSDGSGEGTVSVTFTAQGSVEIKQLVLTRAKQDNAAAGGSAVIADADIFSFLDVPDVSLNGGDTVAYTWTINVD